MVDKKQIGKRYATAIFDICSDEQEVRDTYSALNSIMENFINDIDFKNFITNPLIDVEEKKGVLAKILSMYSEKVINIILYLLEKNRLTSIKDIVAEFLKIYYTDNQILDVKAIFTKALTEEQRKNLISGLEKKTKKSVNLEVIVDPTILGGGIIKIGDTVIDGSLKRELEKWKKN